MGLYSDLRGCVTLRPLLQQLESTFAPIYLTCQGRQIYFDGHAYMFHLGSVSSMLLSGLTRNTDIFTLHSKVEIIG